MHRPGGSAECQQPPLERPLAQPSPAELDTVQLEDGDRLPMTAPIQHVRVRRASACGALVLVGVHTSTDRRDELDLTVDRKTN